jgi:hypothetical protein
MQFRHCLRRQSINRGMKAAIAEAETALRAHPAKVRAVNLEPA